VQNEDRASVDGWSQGIAGESRSLSNEAVKYSRLVVAAGGEPVLGSASEIADQLEALSEKGVDGILCAWFDFEDGLNRLIGDVFPLLEQRGLRKAFPSGTRTSV
jgi:FMNH2-dependent dimethyl sulfone monooxygenase